MSRLWMLWAFKPLIWQNLVNRFLIVDNRATVCQQLSIVILNSAQALAFIAEAFCAFFEFHLL